MHLDCNPFYFGLSSRCSGCNTWGLGVRIRTRIFCRWIILVYNPLFWLYIDVCVLWLDNMFGVWTVWLNALNFIFWFLLWRWSYYDSVAFARKRKYMPWMYYVIKWLKWRICHVRFSWICELMLWHSFRANFIFSDFNYII